MNNMTDTIFESFALEVLGRVELDDDGWYAGATKALAIETCNVILSNNKEIRNLSFEEQKPIIAKEFFERFPEIA